MQIILESVCGNLSSEVLEQQPGRCLPGGQHTLWLRVVLGPGLVEARRGRPRLAAPRLRALEPGGAAHAAHTAHTARRRVAPRRRGEAALAAWRRGLAAEHVRVLDSRKRQR